MISKGRKLALNLILDTTWCVVDPLRIMQDIEIWKGEKKRYMHKQESVLEYEVHKIQWYSMITLPQSNNKRKWKRDKYGDLARELKKNYETRKWRWYHL